MSLRRDHHRRLLFVSCAILSTLLVSIEASNHQVDFGPVKATNSSAEIDKQVSIGHGGLPCGVGFPPSSFHTRIFGGVEAGPGQYPWMVNIHEVGYGHSCGGVIIDERHILTAEHCLDLTLTIAEFNKKSKFYIGDYDETSVDGERTIDIEQIILMEENRSPETVDSPHDIALLRTRQTMEFGLTWFGLSSVNRICLPRKGIDFNFKLEYGRNVTVAGWGKTEKLRSAPILREVDVSIKKCIDQDYEDSPYALCTTTDNGKDSCGGDSGGPLFVQSTSGQFVLAGTVRSGLYCANGINDAIYTNVYNYMEWIDEHLQRS